MKRFNAIGWAVGLTLIGCMAGRGSLAETFPIPNGAIALDSDTGEQLLVGSQSRRDYFPLTHQFLTQDHPAYCGVASMAMVLNALEIPAPVALQGYRSYHFFTQENIFQHHRAIKILTPAMVSRQGMTLEEMAQFLQSYSLDVERHHGGDINLEQFRALAVENLQQPNNFVLVNYSRKTLHQQGGGHISPIAAYHQETDRFLILDVARYKYPPLWVKAADLWQAMATLDRASGKTRGFVLVGKKGEG